jgi:hypothetical protein
MPSLNSLQLMMMDGLLRWWVGSGAWTTAQDAVLRYQHRADLDDAAQRDSARALLMDDCPALPDSLARFLIEAAIQWARARS